MQTLGVISFIKLQNNTKTTVKLWKWDVELGDLSAFSLARLFSCPVIGGMRSYNYSRLQPSVFAFCLGSGWAFGSQTLHGNEQESNVFSSKHGA